MQKLIYKILSLKKLFDKKEETVMLTVPTTLPSLNDKRQAIIETIEFLERNINIVKI